MGTLPYIYSDRRVALVEQYGAVGDGVTNDLAAIHLAVATGLPVVLQPGKNYLINDTLVIDNEGQVLDGAGATITQGFGIDQLKPVISVTANRGEVQNLQLVGAETEEGYVNVSTNFQKPGISLTGTDCRVDNVTITRKIVGVRCEAARASVNSVAFTGVLTAYQASNYAGAIAVEEAGEYPVITNCLLRNTGQGVIFGDNVEAPVVDGNLIQNFWDNGIYGSSCSRAVVSNNNLITGYGTAIKLRGPQNCIVGNVVRDVTAGSGINCTGVFVFDGVKSEYAQKLLWFVGASVKPEIGATITGTESGVTATVVQVYHVAGDFDTGTAYGYLHIKNESGTFDLMEGLFIGSDASTTVAIDSIDAATDTINATSHGLSNGDAGFLSGSAGTTPVRLDPPSTPYYVVNATTNSFQLALTAGGVAIDIESVPAATFKFIKGANLYKAAGLNLNDGMGHGPTIVGNTVEDTTYYGLSITDNQDRPCWGASVVGNTVRNCGQASGFSAVSIEALDCVFIGNQVFDYTGDTCAFSTFYNANDTAGFYPKGLVIADCFFDGGTTVGAIVRVAPKVKITNCNIVGETGSLTLSNCIDYQVHGCNLTGTVLATFPSGEIINNDCTSLLLDTSGGSFRNFRISGNRISGAIQWRPAANTLLESLDISNNNIRNMTDVGIQLIPIDSAATGTVIQTATLRDNHIFVSTADKSPLEILANSTTHLTFKHLIISGGRYEHTQTSSGDVDRCILIDVTDGDGHFILENVKATPAGIIQPAMPLVTVRGFKSQYWRGNVLGRQESNTVRAACQADPTGPLIFENNIIYYLSGSGGMVAESNVTDYWYRNNIVMAEYGSPYNAGRPAIGSADRFWDGYNVYLNEQAADPADPPEGQSVIWQSDGTGSGDPGDIMAKITESSVTKTVTLIDYSAS